MSDLMSNFNIMDKTGTLHQYEIKDASVRQEIESAKELDFDEDQFEITEADTEVKIKVNVFSGATNVSECDVGLVPSASLTDTNKYLRGDGTWATVDYDIVNSNIAENYSNENAYKTGDFVFRKGILYRAKSDVESMSPEVVETEFKNYFTEIQLINYIISLEQRIQALETK